MCNCDLCVRNREIRQKIEELPEDKQEFFNDFFDGLMETEMDLNYYKSIVDGSWPHSDEIICQSRAQRAARLEARALKLPAPSV